MTLVVVIIVAVVLVVALYLAITSYMLINYPIHKTLALSTACFIGTIVNANFPFRLYLNNPTLPYINMEGVTFSIEGPDRVTLSFSILSLLAMIGFLSFLLRPK